MTPALAVLGYLVLAGVAAVWGKFKINDELVRDPAVRLAFGAIWPVWLVFGLVVWVALIVAFLGALLPGSRRYTLSWRGRTVYSGGRWVR